MAACGTEPLLSCPRGVAHAARSSHALPAPVPCLPQQLPVASREAQLEAGAVLGRSEWAAGEATRPVCAPAKEAVPLQVWNRLICLHSTSRGSVYLWKRLQNQLCFPSFSFQAVLSSKVTSEKAAVACLRSAARGWQTEGSQNSLGTKCIYSSVAGADKSFHLKLFKILSCLQPELCRFGRVTSKEHLQKL